jgi:uncharacterized membrane-anchored protein YhcB (DUF1043 family)
MNDLVLKLPDVAPEVSISGVWIAERDELIKSSSTIATVTEKTDFEKAGDYLKKITKTSNKLETMRKEISEPFRNAAEMIKKAADKARESLETEKARLQRLMNAYAAEQARKAEEEREAKRRAEVVARARYSIDTNNPFDVLDVTAPKIPLHMRQRMASEKQVAFLRNAGLPDVERMTLIEASALIETIRTRRERGACTFKQARLLKQLGYGGDFTFDGARQKLDEHFDRARGKATA